MSRKIITVVLAALACVLGSTTAHAYQAETQTTTTSTTQPMPTLPPLPTLTMPTLPPISAPSVQTPVLTVPDLPAPTLPTLEIPELPPIPGTGNSVSTSGSGASQGVTSPQALLETLRADNAPVSVELTPPLEANTTSRLPVRTFMFAGTGIGLLLLAFSVVRRRQEEQDTETPETV